MPFTTTTILDTATRADGAIGANWINDPFHTGGSTPAQIVSNRIQLVGGYSEEYWVASTFAATAGAFSTIGNLPVNTAAILAVGVLGTPSASLATATGYQAYLTFAATNTLTLYRWSAASPSVLVAAVPLATNAVIGDKLGVTVEGGGVVNAWLYQSGAWGTSPALTGTDGSPVDLSAGSFLNLGMSDGGNLLSASDFGGGSLIAPNSYTAPPYVSGPSYAVSRAATI